MTRFFPFPLFILYRSAPAMSALQGGGMVQGRQWSAKRARGEAVVMSRSVVEVAGIGVQEILVVVVI
jgi:hypothetical protein